jgi:glycine/D-amino acid oxidase-like deaminating enzyme
MTVTTTRGTDHRADVLVVGGGLVGAAIAYGLAREGAAVSVIDQGDDVFRASRGNFGLVWIQGKGYGLAPYARWSRSSAQLWPRLAQLLQEDSAVDVQLRQPGGFHMCFSDAELQERQARLATVADEFGAPYPFEMLDAAELKQRLPQIGPRVAGASYTPMDGHVNPLKLLRALHTGARQHGAMFFNCEQVAALDAAPGAFTVHGATRRWHAPKLVLAAGLGNRALAPALGLHAPVRPNRGQVLVSERVQPFLDYPTINVRQTDEGSVQFGDSMEDAGFNDFTSNAVLAAIAQRGVDTFPFLKHVGLVRAWGALRVLSPDGFPIYQQSPRFAGGFVATCHSGVTLAAAHALRLAPWIAGGAAPPELHVFAGERFLPDAAAAPDSAPVVPTASVTPIAHATDTTHADHT